MVLTFFILVAICILVVLLSIPHWRDYGDWEGTFPILSIIMFCVVGIAGIGWISTFFTNLNKIPQYQEKQAYYEVLFSGETLQLETEAISEIHIKVLNYNLMIERKKFVSKQWYNKWAYPDMQMLETIDLTNLPKFSIKKQGIDLNLGEISVTTKTE